MHTNMAAIICHLNPWALNANQESPRIGSPYKNAPTKGQRSKHQATHIPQEKNIPYQTLLTKPVFSLLANAGKTVFSKTSFPV